MKDEIDERHRVLSFVEVLVSSDGKHVCMRDRLMNAGGKKENLSFGNYSCLLRIDFVFIHLNKTERYHDRRAILCYLN